MVVGHSQRDRAMRCPTPRAVWQLASRRIDDAVRAGVKIEQGSLRLRRRPEDQKTGVERSEPIKREYQAWVVRERVDNGLDLAGTRIVLLRQGDMRRVGERPDSRLRLQRRHSIDQFPIGSGITAGSNVDPERHVAFPTSAYSHPQYHRPCRSRSGRAVENVAAFSQGSNSGKTHQRQYRVSAIRCGNARS